MTSLGVVGPSYLQTMCSQQPGVWRASPPAVWRFCWDSIASLSNG